MFLNKKKKKKHLGKKFKTIAGKWEFVLAGTIHTIFH